MNHEERRAKGRTKNDGKSLTDQSQANDTDINVIVKKYGVNAATRGTNAEPEYIDHTQRPKDLREAFEMAHRAQELKNDLPASLRNKTMEELTALTADQLNAILNPPATPPATPPGETK